MTSQAASLCHWKYYLLLTVPTLQHKIFTAATAIEFSTSAHHDMPLKRGRARADFSAACVFPDPAVIEKKIVIIVRP